MICSPLDLLFFIPEFLPISGLRRYIGTSECKQVIDTNGEKGPIRTESDPSLEMA